MSAIAGYDALGAGVAVVRRTDRGVIRLRGADRATWLQGLVTNDVLALLAGQRRYSAWLTPQGRMITDLWIVATDEALLLDVPSPLTTALAARLDSLIFAEDVQVDDVTHEVVLLQVFGAPAPASPTRIVIDDSTYGRPSSAVYLPSADVERFVADLGAGVTWVGLDALDVLRIEAGVPAFLVDMTDDTIPLEAGLEDRAISFTKGCYVGQEVIVRVTTRGGGRVARRLVGLTMGDSTGSSPDVPARGATLHAGRAVGRVTSAAYSPRLGRVIALGYVHRDFVDPGTPLEVHDRERTTAAVVTALPFAAPVSRTAGD